MVALLAVPSSRGRPVAFRFLKCCKLPTVATVLLASSCRSFEVLSKRSAVLRIPEGTWRDAAARHRNRIRELLLPGLTGLDHPLNSGQRRQRRRMNKKDQVEKPIEGNSDDGATGAVWTALDPKNPVYNFLIEYYGLKGSKGPRRLARWSPDPSQLSISDGPRDDSGGAAKEAILLEGASERDVGDTLHMRGAILAEDGEGILYSPSLFFGRDDPSRRADAPKAAAAYLWYRSILRRTLDADPVLHCYNLHEWAMQFHPPGADPPPSARYQSHLPLRVDRETVCSTVERRGVRCTHVDALRFFAPAAAPLNHFGATLERTDQLRLEQPACVHAQMDLLKMALRLQPFVGAELVQSILEVALKARRLDVEASPYDASAYGVDVVPVETPAGRAQYRRRQAALMREAEPIRGQLLDAYDNLLALAFCGEDLDIADRFPGSERFAKASPGSPPWRRNLIETR